MTFRQINEKYLVTAMQTLMILGIIALCQPWILFFHQYGVTIILVGLVGFLVTSHIAPEPEVEDEAIDEAVSGLNFGNKLSEGPANPKGGTA